LTLSNSNTKHKCCLWIKVSLRRNTWWSSFLSSLLFSYKPSATLSVKKKDKSPDPSHQVQHRYFHHALVKVCRPVLDDLDGNNFLRPKVLTLDHLAERALTQNVQYEIAVPFLSC